ncbi:hypothetical protein PVAND_004944 [Polypedilum vanderplanki]|uniref:BRO1 domain-containing protein n=1 Tax=Polypedilum vanderplanki TaxID=319348 RepID=A0A9J6BYN3_POLVA|nr:hypothetical protein PVAND_004944 [Polypedilum vanderplanki]
MDLITVPLKKPYEVDLVKPLKNIIQSTNVKQADNSQIEKINSFNKQRNHAVFKVFEKNEAALEAIYGYYDQLNALEVKIPVHEFQVPFKYKDAFDKGSLFGGRASLTLSSLAYEKVCVLFNIAALQSAIAANQCFDSDDGLKTAAKLFQQAAGIFSHLKSAAPALGQEPTPDLSPDTLHVLSILMLAQAQEVCLFKAIKDGMKDQVIAKLACQNDEMYADVLKSMQKDGLKTLWDKEWLQIVCGKQAGIHAITLLYQANVYHTAKKIGHQIAALQKSVDLFKTASTRAGKPVFEEYNKKAQMKLVEAKKENDFIYNAMIPDSSTLESSGKFQLAKAIPITIPMSTNFKDLFSDLVPVALQSALQACDAQKSEIVNAEIIKLRDATQTLNAVLSSLNLPAAIEVAAPGSSIPPSILEKANEVREKGGVQSIRTLIEELPESLTRNKEILDETERMLNEEKQSDEQLRAQFKEKWTRTPSDKLTEMFRSSAAKYREIITNAITADKVVRQKFESNAEGMEILSKSADELHQAIPASSGSVSNCPSVIKLRSLMEAVETMKAERDVIESELKSATVDMKDQFLNALAADGVIDPNMTISHVGKALTPLQKQVSDSVSRQQALVQEIQDAHKAFTNECGSGTNQRDQVTSQLASAYDIFTELQHNLQEGTKFYSDLTQLLIVFQNKVSDFCFARKTEKEELLKDLTAESSRVASGFQQPTIPSHHGNAPPARPPPPQVQESTSAVPAANAPYPVAMPGMPHPMMGYNYMPPLPTSFNPYATLPHGGIPYPTNFSFPQAGGAQYYGTYPGAYAQQIQQANYPHAPQQQDPNKPYGF